MPRDLYYVASVLGDNIDKNFVKRVVNKDAYPVLQNDDGSHSTHSMAMSEADGKYFVYPTVVQTEKGDLKRLKGKEAVRHAFKTKEYIPFDNPDDALWFSKNYKLFWGNPEVK